MNKVTTAKEAIGKIKDGDTILVAGFLKAGLPDNLVKSLYEDSDAKNLTIVSNDTGTVDTYMIKIQEQGRVSKVHGSYIGSNPRTGQMLIDDKESVTLYPQGTLAEKIRCGGAGIAGFYTPVGVGTIVEEGKEKRVIDGKEYILERALHGDVALVKGTVVDKAGNVHMRGSTKNFGAVMARAADYVICEAQKLVEVGELDPELVTVPGTFIDAIVIAEE